MASKDSVVLRRPLLHIIVLFASDLRVLNYARGVSEKFMQAGVDVFLHVDLKDGSAGETHAPQQIKPEHLSSVIAASHGDFIVVIGDRNFKNDTIQGRKSGKLVEVQIADKVKQLLEVWNSISGLKTPDGLRALQFELDDKAIEGLTEDNLMAKLQNFASIPHPKERLSRIDHSAQEVAELSSKRDGFSGGASTEELSGADQTFVTTLSGLQTTLIRLHRDFSAARDCVDKHPITHVVFPPDRELPFALPHHFDFGLGSGVYCNSSYKPNLPGSGYESTGNAPRRDAHCGILTPVLRQKLLDLCSTTLRHIEQIAEKTQGVVGQTALGVWAEYLKDYEAHRRLMEQPPLPPPLPFHESKEMPYRFDDGRHTARQRDHISRKEAEPLRRASATRPMVDPRDPIRSSAHAAMHFDRAQQPFYPPGYGAMPPQQWHAPPVSVGDRHYGMMGGGGGGPPMWDPRVKPLPRTAPLPHAMFRDPWQNDMHVPYPLAPSMQSHSYPSSSLPPMPDSFGYGSFPSMSHASSLTPPMTSMRDPAPFSAPLNTEAPLFGFPSSHALDVGTTLDSGPAVATSRPLVDAFSFTGVSSALEGITSSAPSRKTPDFLQSLRGASDVPVEPPHLLGASSTPWWTSSGASTSLIQPSISVTARSAPEHPCAVCGCEGLINCEMCAREPPFVSTHYCSASHQSQHFKEHIRYHEDARRRFGMI